MNFSNKFQFILLGILRFYVMHTTQGVASSWNQNDMCFFKFPEEKIF